MRVAIVGPSNLGPYHLARYNCLVDHGVDLHVAAAPIRERFRPWSFGADAATFSVDRPFSGRWSRVYGEARRWVREVEPDAVIAIGYSSVYGLAACAVARELKVPRFLVLVGGRPAVPSVSREVTKQAICRTFFDAALVPGVRAFEYAEQLGIDVDSIWRVGNVVDNAHFARSEGERVVQPRRTFVYVGRLSEEKNLTRLLDAYASYKSLGGGWGLRIVGDGPMKATLAPVAERIGGVEMRGWVGYEDLPDVLADSTALVLPSVYEPWGLVANEAMAAGLPVLVSRRCGCYPELCREGLNGFGFEPDSVESLVGAMGRISDEGEDALRRMGMRSRELVAGYTLDLWAEGVVRALRTKAGQK